MSCTQPVPHSPNNLASFEAAIDSLVAAYPDGIVAVSVRDASKGIAYDRLGDRVFHAASTMKVPVMIEVFRQARLGRFSLDDELLVENAFRSIVDGSIYSIEDDSDDAIYERLGQKMTIRDLVYQMITVSSNLATNLIIDFASADSVQMTAEQMGIQQMKILRGVEDLKAFDLGMSNTATSADLALFFEALRDGNAVSESADQEMLGILMDQQFNEMIPAGLPDEVQVAHKTGQITAIHHDAALIYPANGAPYVLVILIEGIKEEVDSAELGKRISEVAYGWLRG